MTKKLYKNIIAKGLVSLLTIIILLSSILAGSIFYENSITANIIRETSIENKPTISIKEVKDVKELSQLNEGWYQIKNGFVYYLETFNSNVPLYIKVLNPEQQNGLLVVDEDGNIEFNKNFDGLIEKEIVGNKNQESSENQITGKVTGLEKVSGFALYDTFSEALQKAKDDEVATINGKDYRIGKATISIQGGTKEIKVLYPINNPTVAYGTTQSEVFVRSNPSFNFEPAPQGFDITKKGAQTVAGKTYYSDGINYLGYGDDGRKAYEATIKAASQQTFTFRVTDAKDNIIEDSIPISANSKSEALKELQKAYPQGFYKIEDTSSQPSKVGIQIKEVGINKEKILLTYYGKYVGTYDDSTQEDLDKVQTELNRLENLRKNNPTLKTDSDLWNLYFTTNQYQDKSMAEQIAKQLGIQIQAVTPTGKLVEQQPKLPEQLKGVDGSPINAWRLADGKIIYDKSEYDSIVQKQFSEKALKDQKLTSLNKIDEQNRLLAKDPKDNSIWYFDTSTQIYKKIETPTYTTKETIGKDSDAVQIIRTFETETQKQTEIKVITNSGTQDEKSATIDEATLKRIEASGGKGFVIVQGFKVTGGESANIVPQDQILEWRDPKGQVLERQTSSAGYSLGAGTKTTEKFGTAYFYNGKELTKAEYDKLTPEEREKGKATIKQGEDFPIYKETKELSNDGKIKYTIYQFETVFNEKNEPVRVYTATTISQDGKLLEFIYGEVKGQSISYGAPAISPFGVFISCEKKSGPSSLESEGCTRLKQYSSQQFFATVERVFTEFQGLGYYATFFFDDNSLLKWRDNVDRVFATAYLGTEYWSSAICGNYLDGEDRGIAYAETPQGLAQIGAHVEATRSEEIKTPTGREFIYKITFNIRNGDFDKDPRAPEKMNVNVVLKGEKIKKVFKLEHEIKRGSTFGKLGKDAIVKASKVFYNQICLTFDEIPLRWKISNNELCNTIQESAGVSPTILPESTTAPPTEGGISKDEISDF